MQRFVLRTADIHVFLMSERAALTQVYHQYVRLRKDFGRYPAFVDEGAEVKVALCF